MSNSLTIARINEIIESWKKIKPILVIGDIGIDKYTSGNVERISPEAPVCILEVNKEWRKLGLAANVSENLGTLTVPSTLLSVIGDDSRGLELTKMLDERAPLLQHHLVACRGRLTTKKERIVTAKQQICRVDYEEKTEVVGPEREQLLAFTEKSLSEHSSIILEDYGKGLVSEKLCQRLMAISKECGVRINVDPSRTTPPNFYRGAHLLKPNWDEAKIMATALGLDAKQASVETILYYLVDKPHLEKIVITLGAKGMAMLDTKLSSASIKIIPTMAREVFDVSGAGDTTISVLVAALSAGASLEEAGWIANCAAGVVVAKSGTATVDESELRQFVLDIINA